MSYIAKRNHKKPSPLKGNKNAQKDDEPATTHFNIRTTVARKTAVEAVTSNVSEFVNEAVDEKLERES